MHTHTWYCPMQEEQAKKAARAKKFGLTEDRQPLNYTLDPEDLKKAARAKKFGIEYERPSAHTLLQKAGEWDKDTSLGSCLATQWVAELWHHLETARHAGISVPQRPGGAAVGGL
eukprot:GHRR01032468.1.p1 GENE.GHRR01032468.1~~GHRR01032468.1.p1  ORF type:complete len:115 (+),score=35.41 GHRR01032468.1:426-770(+)